MSAFSLLSREIQEYIRDKGWEQPRPIQDVAIRRIIETDLDYILSSKTASGKTEAAFLPVLTLSYGDRYRAGDDCCDEGVRVLYISPLIALINDQMQRMEELCAYLGIPVTKWHGEASASAKNRIIRNPEGVVLMTPESLEAMFQNKPENIARLFGHLDFVIIDEIHYFLGTDRGTHLRSLLERLRQECARHAEDYKPFRWVGLSATIGGDMSAAKGFLGDPERTRVLVDKGKRVTEVCFRYVKRDEDGQVTEQFYDEVYESTKGLQSLVFPNSRAKVEVMANELKARAGDDAVILAHHASLTRQTREEVESTVKAAEGSPFTICCTSTLELGIDLPSVDKICQIESVPSVSSLAQRTGRSGRTSGKAAVDMFCTLEWNLLRNVACWNLYSSGIVEAPDDKALWYNVLVHQILSIVTETTEETAAKRPTKDEVVDKVLSIPAFAFCSREECVSVVDHLMERDILEDVSGKMAIGPAGSRLVRKVNSYVVFATPFNYKVYYNGDCIGELEPSVALKEKYCFMLAARKWVIVRIDHDKRLIDVEISKDAKKPQFISEVPMTAMEVEQEMKRILLDGDDFGFLQEDEAAVLAGLRNEMSKCRLLGETRMPYLTNDAGFICFYPFQGTRVSNTLALLLGARRSDEYMLSIDLSLPKFLRRCKVLLDNPPVLQDILKAKLETKQLELGYKYMEFLPVELQAKMLSTLRYDMEATMAFLAEMCKGVDIPEGDDDFGDGVSGGLDGAPWRDPGRKMQGKVFVYTIFVSEDGNDPELNHSSWDKLHKAEEWLTAKAREYGKDITFVNGEAGLEQTIDHEIAPDGDAPYQWNYLAETYLKAAGFGSVGSFMNWVYEEHGCDRAAIVIMADSRGRSYAMWSNRRSQKYGLLGCTMIYVHDQHEDELPALNSHELLHLFGAMDLYAEVQGVQNAAFIRDTYPGEIMQDLLPDVNRHCMCPMTAWSTWLSDVQEPWFNSFSFS